MKKQAVIPATFPAAIGPYSPALLAGSFVYTSGQLGIDPKTQQLAPGGVEAQTQQILHNLTILLEAAGCTFADVVKTTIFLTNLDSFSAVNALYASYFLAPYPARTTVQVSRLPLQAEIEIEVIAQRPI
jgi:2-iminobutanoate/2-iminopropanoate deaminase